MGLTVSRREGEAIIIRLGDQEVVVRVTQLRGKKVSLNVQAAPEVSIMREELEARRGGES